MAEFFFLSSCAERGGNIEQGKKEEDCVVAPFFLAWLGAGLKKSVELLYVKVWREM